VRSTNCPLGLPHHAKQNNAVIPNEVRNLLFACDHHKLAARPTDHDRIFPMPGRAKIEGHDTRYAKMQKNYCFACGQNNPDGMRLKFTLDEERQTFVCKFRLGKRYTGPPGHCHGGIIATILDDAMGKVNKLHHVIALTKEMTVQYLKPVPLDQPLHVEGREVSVNGREHINEAEIRNEKNEVLARSRGVFIAIDAEKMFGKFVGK
jgi:uncharacterized protein (TIGR00369 family)